MSELTLEEWVERQSHIHVVSPEKLAEYRALGTLQVTEKRTWYNMSSLEEKEWWLRWIRPQ